MRGLAKEILRFRNETELLRVLTRLDYSDFNTYTVHSGVFRTLLIIYAGAVNYFRKKGPSLMFDRVLNTLLRIVDES